MADIEHNDPSTEDGERVGGCTAAGADCLPTNESSSVQVINVKPEHLHYVCEILEDAFRSKRFLACLSVAESYDEMCERFSSTPKDKWELGAVAIDVATTEVLGYVQMTRRGLPSYPEGLHDCVDGEVYIEVLAVSDRARGQGIGTKLLDWCYDKAISIGGKTLTLEVLNGNRALLLYERNGFVVAPKDCGTNLFESVFVLFIFGRPYGWCDCTNCGSSYMVRTLPTNKP
jgi:ribosomal protein S18 acetylase RimI-like enzyme